jgi:predicted metal-dependent hydrolase
VTVTTAPLADQVKAALADAGLLTAYTVRVRVSARRRTLGVTVEPGGQAVTIAVPAGAEPADVAAGVRRMMGRIASAAVKAKATAPDHPTIDLISGTGFRWLGRPERLRVLDGRGPVERVHTSVYGWRLHAYRDDLAEHGARPIIDWYCREGTAWLEREAPDLWSRVTYRQPLPALRVADIGRRRWGVYHRTPHRVTLAWQTLQLPLAMARYVLLHELAHATHPGGRPHGPEFWTVVRRAMPDYERIRRERDEYGRTLWMGDVTGR